MVCNPTAEVRRAWRGGLTAVDHAAEHHADAGAPPAESRALPMIDPHPDPLDTDAAHAVTAFDTLATPRDQRGAVDLLLDDLTEAWPARSAAGAGHTALVVDPSPIARKFLAQRLEGLGYSVQATASAEEALMLNETRAFAVVFVELSLGAGPALDGLALCHAIKQKRGEVPAVVVLTGQPGFSHRVRGELAGCDAYLTKPLAEAQLRAALAAVDPPFR
jgi:CheY-like chemotaxis protein